MRTQRTRSQRYLAAHAAVLVTRAEKLSRRYLHAGDSVLLSLQYSHAHSYGPVRTYARVPKWSGTEWSGTNGTERITSVFNWERIQTEWTNTETFFGLLLYTYMYMYTLCHIHVHVRLFSLTALGAYLCLALFLTHICHLVCRWASLVV